MYCPIYIHKTVILIILGMLQYTVINEINNITERYQFGIESHAVFSYTKQNNPFVSDIYILGLWCILPGNADDGPSSLPSKNLSKEEKYIGQKVSVVYPLLWLIKNDYIILNCLFQKGIINGPFYCLKGLSFPSGFWCSSDDNFI